MSESILKALMQLFALISSPTQDKETRKNVVRNYLSQQLNHKRVEDYLELYESFLQQHATKLLEKEKLNKRYAASSVKILRIATSINEELNHYQKLIVIIQLLEFISSGNENISSLEIEFANTIAETFNFNTVEYLEIFAFITDNFKRDIAGNNLLIVTGNKDDKIKEGRLYREHLSNELRILNIRSGNLFLIKSKKSSELSLNGQLLQSNHVYFMRPGSSLRHKRITPLTYTDISSRFYKHMQKQPFTLEVSDVTYKYPGSQTGLHPVSFTSNSGSLVGIMGDSGAGKTTLVNILTGIYEPKTGEVSINGTKIHTNEDSVKGLIGYVSQDDLLMEDLTVYQNLYYNAKLCFDHLTKASIKRKVMIVLKSLGLFEIRDMKVGNPLNKKISGGQRKRLNIALELIREPAVMFLDEPTSGLSSRDSENIMDLLKELTLKGKLIFVVIHQPSSEIFKMFNQLLILDSGGYLIYDGDAVESINYFKDSINHINREDSECPLCGNVSPEQLLTIINSQVLDEYGSATDTRKISAEEWYNLFNTKNEQNILSKTVVDKKSTLPDITFKIPNKVKQFFIFSTRDILSKLSNRQYLLINLLETPALAFILASLILYFDPGSDNTGTYLFSQNPNITIYIIISVIIVLFIGLSVSAEEIISDRKILKRESFLNLSRLSYLLSKVIILAFISAIQTALLVLIGNSILQIEGMSMPYWIMLFSASIFANLLGLNISDSFKKTINIYILIPFLIIPQLILSGVFVSYDQLNPNLSSTKSIPWYGELITARWAFEGIAVHHFKHNEYQSEFYTYDKLKSQSTYRKDYWIPELNNQLDRLTRIGTEEQERIIKLLYHEIDRHNRLNIGNVTFPLPPSSKNFENSEKNILAVKEYLDKLKTFYINLYNKADEAADDKKRAIIDEKGEDYLIRLKEQHHNNNLERFVRRSNDIFANRVIWTDDALIQKFDPIYMEPSNKFIRAHFLAPQKNIGNKTFETFKANLAVIWIFNLSLFILLYFGLVKRIMIVVETVRKAILRRIPRG